jgi:hypothetical protein
MTLRQDLATTMAYDRVADEFRAPVQIAGLHVEIIDICKSQAATPDALRRSLVRQLQQTLPDTVPRSIRSDVTCMPDTSFAKVEPLVREAVIEQAHQSPTLREVVINDRSGREATEFYGRKRGPSGWMEQYTKTPLLMKRCGDAKY